MGRQLAIAMQGKAVAALLVPITSQSERDKHHRGNQQHEGKNQHPRDWQSDERRNVVNVHGNHREQCAMRPGR
jgi:hypothetical protein